MKKIVFGFMLFALAFVFTSCNSCSKEQNNEPIVFTEQNGLNVERIVATDKEYMYANYGANYVWYETCVLLKDFIDDENCDGTVKGVSNVFQVVTPISETCFDVKVVLISHTADTVDYKVVDDFRIEDCDMNNYNILINYSTAFNRMMEANIVKPHSQHCVLRKEVGPNDCNPQYIFGNPDIQVYVDAINGNVSAINPVFAEPDTTKANKLSPFINF